MLARGLRALHLAVGRRRLRDPDFGFLFDREPEGEVVCFDCETTGLDPKSADIIQLAAVRIRGNRILTSQRLEMTVQPTKAIDAAAIKVHRLRHLDVAEGLPPREAAERFLRFIGARPLVGYYLEFDIALVNRVIRPWLGIGLPNRAIEVSGLFYDYTQRGRDAAYTGNVDLRFDTIRQALNLPELDAHDALNDAVMTAQMYIKLKALGGRA